MSWQPTRRPAGRRGGPGLLMSSMKLDPVAPGRITADGGITAEVLLHLSLSGPGDPQVDHARRLHVSNLPARGEQGRLIAIARSPFRDRPDREQGDDESLPKHVTAVITHCRQDKRNVPPRTMDATRRLCEQNRTFCGRRTAYRQRLLVGDRVGRSARRDLHAASHFELSVLDATHARGFDMGGNPIVSVAACPAPERMFWSMDAVAVRETPIVLSFIPIGCGQPIRRPGPGCRARQARARPPGRRRRNRRAGRKLKRVAPMWGALWRWSWRPGILWNDPGSGPRPGADTAPALDDHFALSIACLHRRARQGCPRLPGAGPRSRARPDRGYRT